MMGPRRWLSSILRGERRGTKARTPIFLGARLELDVVELSGTARDLSDGGVFLETAVPLPRGVRGHLSREGGRERIPVRVSWRRPASGRRRAGVGLAFE